uniref:Dual specificity protein phosphatase 1 n=1 Tax=Davidia involucrata TaxID=16924 RepID=A0A5B7CFK7_DAVIN
MDRFDEIYKERIAALWRAMYATKCIREDNVPCQIEEGLFLGSLGAANNKSTLKSLNVTHILTVANSLAPAHPNDFIYKIIDVPDREGINIAQYFDECFNFIDEAKRMGGGVLVHCFVGRSRSVTMVVAYLMKKHGMSVSQALEHVKSKRPLAAPNSGFMSQLQNFEKSLQVPYSQPLTISSKLPFTQIDVCISPFPPQPS